jgi:PadR family transcriptional regulator, regulatory protein PadR
MAAPIGEFEVLVLMAVLRLGDGGYAPAVRTEIERRTGRAVSRGAVYVTLGRLETKGLLASRAADEQAETGGRPRRYYRVSPKGVKAIRRTLAAIEQMSNGLALVPSRA